MRPVIVVERDEEAPGLASGLQTGTAFATGLCALLAFAVLAFGAVEPWATFGLQVGAVTLLLAWCLWQWTQPEIRIHPHPLLLPCLAFAGVVLLQLMAGSSFYAQTTRNLALLYGAYFVLLFITTQVSRGSRELERIAIAFSVFGFLLAVFALIQDFTSHGLLYWYRQPRFGGSIFGPYVNRNHYAGIMELLTPFPLLLALSPRFEPLQRSLFGFMAVICGASVFMSGSRGGSLAFLAQCLFLSLMTLTRRRKHTLQIGILVFIIAVVGAMYWLDASAAMQRWTQVKDELSGGRVDITRDAVRMWRERPVLGFGLGSFPHAYPHYRSFYTDRYVNQAHNDYAQLLVETGVLGAGAMMWFIVALYRPAFGRRRDPRHDVGAAVRLAALTGCTGILVHSLVDFNLQIPANAAMFYVCAAISSQEGEQS